MRLRDCALALSALMLTVGLAACGEDDPITAPSRSESSASESSNPSAVALSSPHELRTTADLEAPDAAALAPVRKLVAAGGPRSAAAPVALSMEDGICFSAAEAETGAPDYATEIDCSQSHSVEVHGRLEMDDSWPGGPLDQWDDASWERWVEWADPQCADRWAEKVGSARVAAALGVEHVGVTFPGVTWMSIPTALWDEGTRLTVCSVASSDATGAPGEWTPTILTANRPNHFSLCDALSTPDTVTTGTCDQPHFREYAVSVDIAPVLGSEFAAGVDPAQPTEEQYAQMDGLCAKSEAALLGQERDDLRMFGDPHTGAWNTEGNGRYWVMCTISPQDGSQQVSGSALGIGAGELEFSPIPS